MVCGRVFGDASDCLNFGKGAVVGGSFASN
jgi:hypothetical protein